MDSDTIEAGVRINNPCWLTTDLVRWLLSVKDEWALVGYRYEYEKKVIKAHGFDFFLEVEYAPLVPGLDFPCVQYIRPDLPHWYLWWCDIIEFSHVKIISRLTLKEDMCCESYDEG